MNKCHSDQDTLSEPWLTIGKIVAPHGLKGEVRINPSSDFSERFTKPGERWIQKEQEQPQSIQLIFGRQVPGKSIYIVRFQNINNRTIAEKLIGNNLLVPSTDRPKLRKNEFHLLDLIGLEVKLEKDGQVIGRVTQLTSAGNDLLEIELKQGKKVLIPFVKSIVPKVDIDKGWLIISPPKGLLEL